MKLNGVNITKVTIAVSFKMSRVGLIFFITDNCLILSSCHMKCNINSFRKSDKQRITNNNLLIIITQKTSK